MDLLRDFFQQHERINALLPFYEGGNTSTKVLLKGSQEIVVPRKPKGLLKMLARFLQVDFQAAQRNAQKVLGQKRGVPLFYHQGLVFIVARCRRPLHRDDGSLAYINAVQVVGYTGAARTPACKVHFNDETALEIINTRDYLERELQRARTLKSHYQQLFPPPEPTSETINILLQELQRKFLILFPFNDPRFPFNDPR